jgi:hypothetical protein
MSFAPNGTLYVVTGYFGPTPPVVRVSGTGGPSPATVTPLPGLHSFFWVNVAESGPDGEARSLLTLFTEGLKLVDLTTDPPTETVVARNLGGGIIGPDGCLYAPVGTTVYRLTDSTGGCRFVPGAARPLISLTPAAVSPNPAQGSSQSFTATFRNLDVPLGTPVFFSVSGANERFQMVRTDAGGQAAFSYAAVAAGNDRIVAAASVGEQTLASNVARVTWSAGRHMTFLTLNRSPTSGLRGQPASVVASLTDVSLESPAPVAGASVDFSLGAAQCSAATDGDGNAACEITPQAAGMTTLTATFAGTPALAGATDTGPFNVVASAPADCPCAGDCDGDRQVTPAERARGVDIALGNVPVAECLCADTNHDTRVTVDELVQAVGAAVGGACI